MSELGKLHAFSRGIMLNQFKTIETNLRARLDTKRTLRRMERLSEKQELRKEQERVETSAAPLPPESVYFIIELA
jgi:hypothetical protein